ncbi:MAG: hypothetical protein FJ118_11490 [Deltaproteobacteria bacterium]|nr:hypothetical protein [Deltaproteobacteria bacterium]
MRVGLLLFCLVTVFAVGCSAPRGITEILYEPYALLYEDDSTERFGNKDDSVLIEIRKAAMPRKLDNLAIHYNAFFPGGEIIRPGDLEEYLTIDKRKAYRVTFRTKYIRRRQRAPADATQENVPPGWTFGSMIDPNSGASIRVLYGPVAPVFSRLYLVEGDAFLYYIFVRAEGDLIDSAREKFEKFVQSGIDYR